MHAINEDVCQYNYYYSYVVSPGLPARVYSSQKIINDRDIPQCHNNNYYTLHNVALNSDNSIIMIGYRINSKLISLIISVNTWIH